MSEHVAVSWAETLPTATLLSADDWMALPEDRWRYEIVAGRLLRLPAADLRYEIIASDFLRTVGNYVLGSGLGRVTVPDTGFLVGSPEEQDTVLVPALAYVRAERLPADHASSPTTYLRLAPDLVIEIAAPGQSRPMLAEKTALWLAAGVRLVWVVWPNRRQVEVSRSVDGVLDLQTLNADGVLDGGEVIPGLTIRVGHVFL